MLACLVVGYALLDAVLERAALSQLRKWAAAQGFPQVDVQRLDLSLPGGRVLVRGLRAAGAPVAASGHVRRAEISLQQLSATLDYGALVFSREPSPSSRVADRLPPYLARFSFDVAHASAELDSGARPRLHKTNVSAHRTATGEWSFRAYGDALTDEARPELSLKDLVVTLETSGPGLSRVDCLFDHELGTFKVAGRIKDLLRLREEVARARSANEPAEALAAFTDSGLHLLAVANPNATGEGAPASGVEFRPPSLAALKIASGSSGLSVAVFARDLALSGGWGEVAIPQLEAHADAAGTVLEQASAFFTPPTRRGGEGDSVPLVFPVEFSGGAAMERPFAWQVEVRPASPVTISPLKKGGWAGFVPADGEAMLELFASGTLAPATVTHATANLHLDGLVHPPGLPEPLRMAGELAGDWDGSRLLVNTRDLSVGEGALSARLESSWRAGRFDLPVGEIELRRFPASVVVAYASALRATGVVDASVSLTPALIRGVGGDFSATLDELAWDEVSIRPADVSSRVSWNGATVRFDGFSIRSGASRLQAHGRLDLSASRALDISFAADLSSEVLRSLPPLPELEIGPQSSLSLTGSCSGTLESPNFAARFLAKGARYRGVEVDEARGVLFWEDRRLQLREVSVEGAEARFRGSLDWDFGTRRGWALSVAADRLPLAMVQSFLAQPMPVDGVVSGRLEMEWRNGLSALSAELASARMEAMGETATDVSLRATLERGQVKGRLSLSLWDGCTSATAEGALAGPLHLQAEVMDLAPPLTRGTGRDFGRWSGRAHATWNAPLLPWPADARRAWMRHLTADAHFTGHDARHDRLNFERLVVDASLVDGLASLSVLSASPDLQLSAARELSSDETRLWGAWRELELVRLVSDTTAPLTISSSGAMTGLWHDRQGPQLEVSCRRTALALPGWNLEQTQPTRLRIHASRVEIPPWEWRDPRLPDARLSLSGSVTWETGEPILDIGYRLERLNLSGLSELAWWVHELSGVVEGSGRVTGPVGDPAIVGQVQGREIRLRAEGLPDTFYDGRFTLAGDENALALRELSGRMGRGTIVASGEITLAGGSPRIELAGRFADLRYTDGRDLSVEGEGRLRLAGPLGSPLLSGDVRITRGAYTRAFDWTRLVLARLGPRPAPAPRTAAWQPRLDLAVAVPGNFWVRNSMVNAELSGRGRLVGRLLSPSFTGKADVLRGAFQLDFARFQFERASAIFEESRPFKPYLLVSGVAREAGYVIRVEISGEPNALELAWSSSPPLSEEEIVRLLSTGTVARNGASGSSAAAAWILTQGLRHSAGETASRALAVDSLELRPVRTEQGVASELVAEERLTERFTLKQYVGVEDPSTSGLGADLSLSRRLRLSGRARRNNVYILEMIYEILF